MSDSGDGEMDVLPTAAATPGGGRRSRAVDGGAIIEAVVELMRETLSELLAPAAVEAALRKAQKGAAMKALLSRAKGAPKGPKTPGKLRSAYTAFVQECFHALKEANIQSDLQTVAGLWKLLPEHVISDVQGRFNAIKPSYNAKIEAGQSVNLGEELAAHAKANGLPPINYVQIFNRYKGAAAASHGTAAAAGMAAAAAAASAVPLPGDKRAADGAVDPEKKKKHKKHKKDKEKKSKEKSKKSKSHDEEEEGSD